MPDEFQDRSVLFVSPCFLANRLHKSVRGVVVFDFHLIRQLAALGVRLTVPAERSWKRQFAEHLAGVDFEPLYTPSLRKPLPNTIAAAIVNGRRRYDAIILGNTAHGMIPGLRMMHRKGCFDRATLIAHRVVKPGVVRGLRGMDLTPIAVSEKISAGLSALTGGPVDIYYGLPNPGLFTPRESGQHHDGVVRMCLLGNLADPGKGVEIASEAFCALPESLRDRAEIHLASYLDPPQTAHPRIIAHEWKPASEVPGFLRSMDAMLVPSEKETFSQAVVQGMLTSLPIVASNIPALSEKLDTGGGFICDTQEQYTGAMAELIESEQARERMGAIARRTALERYVWDTAHFLRTYVFNEDR